MLKMSPKEPDMRLADASNYKKLIASLSKIKLRSKKKLNAASPA